MATFNSFSLLILTLSLLSSTSAAQPRSSASPPPPQPLLNAVETLANSGYTAMSLTLELIAATLPLPSSSSSATTPPLTIFSPPDSAFSTSGQPSLPHLLLHFSPLSLSPASLNSLPFSSTIPSLSPSKHLTVTSTHPNNISINNLKISQYPIHDDGFILVYAIDDFFDLNFTLPLTNSPKPNPRTDFQCLKLETVSLFGEASGVLKSRGYSIMASFLDLQLMGFIDHVEHEEYVAKWTVFAPVDEELVPFSGDFIRYSSLFMRHLVSCKVGWGDLDEMENGTVVSNNVEGFGLVISKDKDDEILMVNGVEITFPDMYDSEWLVIHGIGGVISLPESLEEGLDFSDEAAIPSAHEEF